MNSYCFEGLIFFDVRPHRPVNSYLRFGVA